MIAFLVYVVVPLVNIANWLIGNISSEVFYFIMFVNLFVLPFIQGLLMGVCVWIKNR